MESITAYTIEEAAAILKVRTRFLYPYLQKGELKGVKIGNAWRISGEALRSFLSTGAPIMDANRRKMRVPA